MATFFTELDEKLKRFIDDQGIFFVATALEADASTYRPRAWTVYREDEEWGVLSSHFEIPTGARQIVVLKIDTIQTSCG